MKTLTSIVSFAFLALCLTLVSCHDESLVDPKLESITLSDVEADSSVIKGTENSNLYNQVARSIKRKAISTNDLPIFYFNKDSSAVLSTIYYTTNNGFGGEAHLSGLLILPIVTTQEIYQRHRFRDPEPTDSATSPLNKILIYCPNIDENYGNSNTLPSECGERLHVKGDNIYDGLVDYATATNSMVFVPDYMGYGSGKKNDCPYLNMQLNACQIMDGLWEATSIVSNLISDDLIIDLNSVDYYGAYFTNELAQLKAFLHLRLAHTFDKGNIPLLVAGQEYGAAMAYAFAKFFNAWHYNNTIWTLRGVCGVNGPLAISFHPCNYLTADPTTYPNYVKALKAFTKYNSNFYEQGSNGKPNWEVRRKRDINIIERDDYPKKQGGTLSDYFDNTLISYFYECKETCFDMPITDPKQPIYPEGSDGLVGHFSNDRIDNKADYERPYLCLANALRDNTLATTNVEIPSTSKMLVINYDYYNDPLCDIKKRDTYLLYRNYSQYNKNNAGNFKHLRWTPNKKFTEQKFIGMMTKICQALTGVTSAEIKDDTENNYWDKVPETYFLTNGNYPFPW